MSNPTVVFFFALLCKPSNLTTQNDYEAYTSHNEQSVVMGQSVRVRVCVTHTSSHIFTHSHTLSLGIIQLTTIIDNI